MCVCVCPVYGLNLVYRAACLSACRFRCCCCCCCCPPGQHIYTISHLIHVFLLPFALCPLSTHRTHCECVCVLLALWYCYNCCWCYCLASHFLHWLRLLLLLPNLAQVASLTFPWPSAAATLLQCADLLIRRSTRRCRHTVVIEKLSEGGKQPNSCNSWNIVDSQVAARTAPSAVRKYGNNICILYDMYVCGISSINTSWARSKQPQLLRLCNDFCCSSRTRVRKTHVCWLTTRNP